MSLTAAAGRVLKSVGHGLAQLPSMVQRDRFRLWYGADAETVAAQRSAAMQYLMQKQADEEQSRQLENMNRASIIQERQLTMERARLGLQDDALTRYRGAAGVLAGGNELPPGEPGPPAPPDFSGLDTSQLPAWARQNPGALQQDILRTQAQARDKQGTAEAAAQLPFQRLAFDKQEHADLQTQRAFENAHRRAETPVEHLTKDERDAKDAWDEAAKLEQARIIPGAPINDDTMQAAIATRAAKILAARKRYRKNIGIPVPGGLTAVVPSSPGGAIDLSDIAPGLTVTQR
jgi:hypothetical protein